MKLPLTENQRRVYEFVEDYIRKNNYPPLNTEIAIAVGLKNPGAVHAALLALESKNWITKVKGKHRGIALQQELT